MDLLRQFEYAEKRPPHGTFELKEHTLGGVSRATLVVPSQSRITWKLRLPHRGRLQAFVAFPESTSGSVAVRVGISDGRIYTTLTEKTVSAAEMHAGGWMPVEADLSMYAGRKWSLFYKPDNTQWSLILGTHVLSGNVGAVYLGAPAVLTDVEGAREYVVRLTR